MIKQALTTTQKALAINVDPTNYGSIAEIGAGQETARFFFQAGGAAGTIAKSMSAYDMTISDEIYGREEKGRYVCHSRLEAMLDNEYEMIRDILADKHKGEKRLFAFADTVTTRSYSRPDAEAHGWIGIRFQHEPGADAPSDIIVHCRLLSGDFRTQQEMVGILGVNLIYATFYLFDEPEKAIESLIDNLSPGSVEIDLVEFEGPFAKDHNQHLTCLHLVRANMTPAILFDKNGKIKQPSEILYRKPTLIQRGSFRPITHVNTDMQRCASAQFMQEAAVKDKDSAILMEITMSNLEAIGELSEQDFLDRVNLLTMLGHSVLITNFPEHYQFASYLSRNTRAMFAIVIGVSNLREVFRSKYYDNVDGGIMEACGRLFHHGGKLYIYPEYDHDSKQLITAANLDVEPEQKWLYDHLYQQGLIVDLHDCDVSKLSIFSSNVLEMIQQDKTGWEEYVPDQVVEVIKSNHLWGAR